MPPIKSKAAPPSLDFGLLVALAAGCCALFAVEAVELIHILVIPSYWNAP